jgi:hypothetical protein
MLARARAGQTIENDRDTDWLGYWPNQPMVSRPCSGHNSGPLVHVLMVQLCIGYDCLTKSNRGREGPVGEAGTRRL